MATSDHPTQAKLLDAAEQLFAEKGFEAVSVRELAVAAGVNVAAVNYHFQGKENLFREVIQRRFTAQRDRTLTALNRLLAETAGRPAVDQVIAALVGQFLGGTLTDSGHSTFLTCMAREMNTGRTATSTLFFRDMVAPIFHAFSDALVAARPGLKQEDLNWIIASIIGQIHHFVMRRLKLRMMESEPEAREVMLHAFPALMLPLPEYVQQVTDHVTRFCTAAIDGLYPEASA